MSLKNLTDETGGVWIRPFLQEIYKTIDSKENITEQDIVVVMDLEYLKRINVIFDDFETPQVVQNYLVWRILQRVGYLSTEEFRQNEFEFQKVQQGIKKPVDMEKRCMDSISEVVPDLVGRAYVDNFFTSQEKASANLMISAILETFKAIVREKEWMDKETRDNSLKKANKLRVNTAFPDWIKNNSELEKMYDFVSKLSFFAQKS